MAYVQTSTHRRDPRAESNGPGPIFGPIRRRCLAAIPGASKSRAAQAGAYQWVGAEEVGYADGVVAVWTAQTRLVASMQQSPANATMKIFRGSGIVQV